jgi:hypothetical protein
MFSEIVPLLQTRLDEVPLELYYSWLTPGHATDQHQKYNELKRWLEARMGNVSNSDLMAAIVQEFKDVTLEYSHDELCRRFGDRLLWLHQRGAQAYEDDISILRFNWYYSGSRKEDHAGFRLFVTTRNAKVALRVAEEEGYVEGAEWARRVISGEKRPVWLEGTRKSKRLQG